MIPERMTDGVKPVSAIKKSTNPPARSTDARGPTRARFSSDKAAMAQTLMCRPLTERRWEMPIS